MNDVQPILMELVRFCLTGEGLREETKAAINDGMLEQLYTLSSFHDMSHMVAYALDTEGLLPKEGDTSKKLRGRMMAAMARYADLNYELSRVAKLLEEEGIPFVPLKGAVMRGCYPKPWLRTSCDIDILIKQEDLARITDLLTSRLGYEAGRRSVCHASFLCPGATHVEMHYSLFDGLPEALSGAVALMQQVWDYTLPVEGWRYRYRLTDDMFYFYHVAHLVKHFEKAGCGIRPFIDLWLLNRRLTPPETMLREGGLLTFTEAASALADKWITGGTLDEFSQRMTDYILGSGAYGTRQNSHTVHAVKQGKLGHLASLFFPPYHKMIEMYPALQRHKLLLPCCYVVRWCRLIFKERKRAARQLTLINRIDADSISGVEEILCTLGLRIKTP